MHPEPAAPANAKSTIWKAVNAIRLVERAAAMRRRALRRRFREEVRLADCFRNGHEVHLKPGAGDIDFADMFRRIEGKRFSGHYTNAFGSLDDMLAGRDELVRLAGLTRSDPTLR